jgi:hypothetical protein
MARVDEDKSEAALPSSNLKIGADFSRGCCPPL